MLRKCSRFSGIRLMFRTIKSLFLKITPLLFVVLCIPLTGFEIRLPVPPDTEPSRISLRNQSGAAFSKGDLVAVTGFNVTEGLPTADLADKDLSAFRPAIAVIEASVPNLTNFKGLVTGLLVGVDTSSFVVNAQLVLGDDGQVSTPPPDTDPFTGEVQMIGSVVRSDVTNGSIYFALSSDLMPMTAAQFFWTKDAATTGFISGGDVTRVSGLDVAVTSGTGFVNTSGTLFRVTWSAVSNLTLTASDTNHIFVDSAGLVQDSTTVPDLESNVVLATAITDGTTVIFLSNHNVSIPERAAKAHQYTQDVIGPIVVSGIITSKNATALRLDVSSGVFYVRDFRATVPAGANPITFTYWFRDGSGGFTKVASQTVIDTVKFDDGSGTLANIPATQFKKDVLLVSPTSAGDVEQHVFYGQETFSSQSAAEAGNLPAVDSDVLDNAIRSGGIVILENAATIASVVDVRPFLGQLSPGTTAVTDHGLLSGLSGDDHTQYQLRSEKDAFSGYAGLDGSGDIALAAVPAHASTHTNATDDIQDATATVKGLATSTQISKLDGIENAAKDDQSAAEVPFSPTGGIAATDTQAAVAEVDSEAEKTANKNAASGYAGLSAGSKLDGSQQVYGTSANTATEGNDARVPTTGENDALQGTTGTPSNTNRYVTDEDNRMDIHWDLKTAGEGSFEVFAGTPGMKSPNWDSTDLMAYILVTGSAVDDQGGVVYEFIIPEGVTDLTEVSCTGKLGVASQDAITVRVKREDGTQVDTGGPHQITAATETLLVINTFSGETFVPGQRFIIEVEYQGDSTETGEIGSCLVEMAR